MWMTWTFPLKSLLSPEITPCGFLPNPSCTWLYHLTVSLYHSWKILPKQWQISRTILLCPLLVCCFSCCFPYARFRNYLIIHKHPPTAAPYSSPLKSEPSSGAFSCLAFANKDFAEHVVVDFLSPYFHYHKRQCLHLDWNLNKCQEDKECKVLSPVNGTS